MSKRKRTGEKAEKSFLNLSDSSAGTSSPKKHYSTNKLATVREDHDVEVNSHDDEVNGNTKKAENVNLKRLFDFIQVISDASEANADFKKKRANTNLETFLTNEQRQQFSDIDGLQAAFRSYYVKAVAISKVSIPFATKRIIEYMGEGIFVQNHPHYPKLNLSSHMFMCRKLGLGFGGNREVRDRLQNHSDPLVLEAIRESELDKKRYYNELEEFINKYEDELLPSHVEFVKKKLERHRKETQKASGEAASPKPKKSKSKARLTAFDYFKMTKKHKYLDLDPEEREEKLKKRFEKLEEDKRRIYEEMELNLQD